MLHRSLQLVEIYQQRKEALLRRGLHSVNSHEYAVEACGSRHAGNWLTAEAEFLLTYPQSNIQFAAAQDGRGVTAADRSV